jgi:hypothetical protein
MIAGHRNAQGAILGEHCFAGAAIPMIRLALGPSLAPRYPRWWLISAPIALDLDLFEGLKDRVELGGGPRSVHALIRQDRRNSDDGDGYRAGPIRACR